MRYPAPRQQLLRMLRQCAVLMLEAEAVVGLSVRLRRRMLRMVARIRAVLAAG